MINTRPKLILFFCLLLLVLVSNAQMPNSFNLFIGDFNNDGKDDYIRQRTGDWATDSQEGNAELFLAQEDGQFQSSPLRYEFDIRTNNVNLYVGDFNGDGIPDILRQETGDWSPDLTNTAYLLISNGNGDFTKHVLSEDFKLGGDLLRSIYIGDFNGDGKDDIFRREHDDVAVPGLTNILLAVDDESRFFEAVDLTPIIELDEAPGTFLSRQLSVLIGDFNGDNCTDIIRFVTDLVDVDYTGVLFLSNGDGSTFEEINLTGPFGSGAFSTDYFHVGDFNGDGNDDFVQAKASGNPSQLFLSNGDGTFEGMALSEEVLMNFRDVIVGDFNGDGNADLFRQGTLYLSTGNNFEMTQPLPTPFASIYYVGDFNGDNITDLLEDLGSLGNVNVHLSNGDGTFL